tara:strand:- start:31219 stop:31491 length:273 start_codon:yes stop_codon:yes gene_type:complete
MKKQKQEIENHGDFGTRQGERPSQKPDEVKIPKKQLDSSKRMQTLSKEVSKAIKTASEAIDGDFTLMEVIHVMNQNINAYVTHGLKSEWS